MILYIQNPRTLYSLDEDAVKFLRSFSVNHYSVEDNNYRLLAQKICLEESKMAELLELIYFTSMGDVELKYVPVTITREVYLGME